MASTTFSGPVTSTAGFVGAVTGAVTGNVTGNLTGNVVLPVASVAAAGSDNTNAAALSAGINVVTASDGTKGVILPTAAAGQVVIVKNSVNAVLKVYPSGAGVQINALTAQTGAISMAANTSALFFSTSATQTYTLPLLPS